MIYSHQNPQPLQVENYTAVYPQILREVEHFFAIYKDVEGKRTLAIGWEGVGAGRKMVLACHGRYKENLHL